jgi:four helix bundle protein
MASWHQGQVDCVEQSFSNPAIQSFRDLIAWQKAFRLGLAVYEIASDLPDRERFGLTSQLCRGAVAVASNIAEGYGRGSRVDYVRFLKIARGAIYEIDTQLMFTVELGYVTSERYDSVKAQLDECERILAGLIRSLERTAAKPAR